MIEFYYKLPNSEFIISLLKSLGSCSFPLIHFYMQNVVSPFGLLSASYLYAQNASLPCVVQHYK
jgi:hypothetical protein